ncbi:MAG: hypothetical protein GX838_06780, partial [Clostridiaceae bacterium]|nr:hypothetical protein [Clostridiaceae bacterium]
MSSIYLANFKPALTSVTFLADSSPAELYTYWSYSLNGGSYVPFYEGSTYRANCTITGLTEGTTYTVKVRAYLSGVGTLYYTTTYSFSTLKNQTPPTVTCSVTSVTHNSFKITGTANYKCKTWQYSIDDGSTWTAMTAAANGKSATVTKSGLSADTTYKVKVRATRTYNDVRGTSSRVTATTIGASTLDSVSTVTADASTVSIKFNWTVPAGTGFTHTLRIKDGGTTVVTVTGLTGASGSKTISLNSTQRTALLNRMPNKKSFTGTFELETLDGATRVGSLSSKTATVTTTEANSRPTMTGFTNSEENAKVSAVVGGSYYVQNLSDIKVMCDDATAQNGASISKYGVKIGSRTVESGSTTVNFGAPAQCGANYLIEVYVEDSRGYRTILDDTKTIGCYGIPQVLEWQTRRKDSVGEQTALRVIGITRYSAGATLKKAEYRVKPSDGGYGAWTELIPTTFVSGAPAGWRAYEYNEIDWEVLNAYKSYTVQIRYQDIFDEYSSAIAFTVARGIPLVSFRDGKIGINQHDPQVALDVVGGLLVDGSPVVKASKTRKLMIPGPTWAVGTARLRIDSGTTFYYPYLPAGTKIKKISIYFASDSTSRT